MKEIYNLIYQIISWICVGESTVEPTSPLAYVIPLIALFLCVYCTWKMVKFILRLLKNLFNL